MRDSARIRAIREILTSEAFLAKDAKIRFKDVPLPWKNLMEYNESKATGAEPEAVTDLVRDVRKTFPQSTK